MVCVLGRIFYIKQSAIHKWKGEEILKWLYEALYGLFHFNRSYMLGSCGEVDGLYTHRSTQSRATTSSQNRKSTNISCSFSQRYVVEILFLAGTRKRNSFFHLGPDRSFLCYLDLLREQRPEMCSGDFFEEMSHHQA